MSGSEQGAASGEQQAGAARLEGSAPGSGVRVVPSVHHPAGASRAVLALQAQARPLAGAVVVVMTLGLAAALQGAAVLVPVLAATAAAYAVAGFVAQGRLMRTPALVALGDGRAAILSVWDAASPPRTVETAPVWSARLVAGELHVGLGDRVETFQRSDWADFEALVEVFRAAAEVGAAGAFVDGAEGFS